MRMHAHDTYCHDYDISSRQTSYVTQDGGSKLRPSHQSTAPSFCLIHHTAPWSSTPLSNQMSTNATVSTLPIQISPCAPTINKYQSANLSCSLLTCSAASVICPACCQEGHPRSTSENCMLNSRRYISLTLIPPSPFKVKMLTQSFTNQLNLQAGNNC
jgi:hypothetical protein